MLQRQLSFVGQHSSAVVQQVRVLVCVAANTKHFETQFGCLLCVSTATVPLSFFFALCSFPTLSAHRIFCKRRLEQQQHLTTTFIRRAL